MNFQLLGLMQSVGKSRGGEQLQKGNYHFRVKKTPPPKPGHVGFCQNPGFFRLEKTRLRASLRF